MNLFFKMWTIVAQCYIPLNIAIYVLP
jgi:hypothetical protein